jgi:hypothetical protein
MALTTYYLGQKEEIDVLKCKSRSQVCSVPEKSHSMKMHSLSDHSVKKKELSLAWELLQINKYLYRNNH